MMGSSFLKLSRFIVKWVVQSEFDKKDDFDLSSGSVIMAIGVCLTGVIHQFSFVDKLLGDFLACLLIIAWILIIRTFIQCFYHYKSRNLILAGPILSFGMGTMVASTSVIGTVVITRFDSFTPIIKILAVINTFLWGIFIIICIMQYRAIIVKKLHQQVHGILFLSTVSTQSIVLLLNSAFSQSIPPSIFRVIILFGIGLYLVSFGLIISRYVSKQPWNLAEDWKNTNCIIHGSVSITGLATIYTGVFSLDIIYLIWCVALILVISVEIIELARAMSRVKNYGIKQGLLSYHISQWARVFTFGMFYKFTGAVPLTSLPFSNYITKLLPVWGWMVMILLLLELGLLIKSMTDVRSTETVKMTI